MEAAAAWRAAVESDIGACRTSWAGNPITNAIFVVPRDASLRLP